MKKQVILVAVAVGMFFGCSVAFAGLDIVPWSYTTGDKQVFSFSFPQGTDQEISVTVSGKKKNTAVNMDASDDRVEVEAFAPGNYVIHARVKANEWLRQDVSRPVVLNMGYPVKVGKVFFTNHFRMSLAEGDVGYNFIVYPQFGYVMPDRIEAEMTFGDVTKTVAFNCGQKYIQSYGYCTTSLVEFSPEEYVQIVGDTYTCFKSKDTESCRIMRYYDFQ